MSNATLSDVTVDFKKGTVTVAGTSDEVSEQNLPTVTLLRNSAVINS